MTEELAYEVVDHLPDGVELRRYPAHGVAEVTVCGSLGGAGNSAFAPLFSYISGSNRPRASVAMTAPVVQQPASRPHPPRRGERVAMTAPVVQEEAGAGSAPWQWWRRSAPRSPVLPGALDPDLRPRVLESSPRSLSRAPGP